MSFDGERWRMSAEFPLEAQPGVEPPELRG
jgi:hypothetical protein